MCETILTLLNYGEPFKVGVAVAEKFEFAALTR